MLIEVTGPYGPRGLKRVEFSAYVEYGRADLGERLTRADLVLGREIGMIVYGRPDATLRATRIWFW